MCGARCLFALMCAGSLLAQRAEEPMREGVYWSQGVSGTTARADARRLRVATLGDITVSGEERKDIAWGLKKRVRAPQAAAARRLLDEIVLETERRGDSLELSVRRPPGADVLAALQLSVPRSWREVALTTESGAIEVSHIRGTVRVETHAGPVSLTDVEGRAEVRTGGGPVRLSRIRGMVRCFSGGGAIVAEQLAVGGELLTRGGEIRVREAGGSLRVTSGGGSVRVERARAVRAGTEGGLVEILEASGPVVAATAQGPIRIHRAKGVRANSGAGRIQLQDVSGSVQASTGLGHILAAPALTGSLENWLLTTPTGDITVFLPSNIAVTLEAEAGGGTAGIVSEFSAVRVRRAARGAEARATLNGGGRLLRLSAPGGTIYLKKLEALRPPGERR